MGRLIEKNIDDVKLLGFSLAGEETVIAAPELNVCFDIGRAPREVISIDNICLSHGHMDHAAGIAYYFSQRAFIGNAPGRLIVHRRLAQSFQKLMDVWSDIEKHPSPGEVIGVEHLEDTPIRRGLFVRAFDVNHCDGALGFTIIEKRHKLKAEFIGKSGPQLVALKKEGIEIEDRAEVPLITYTGDTAIGRFLDLDFVKNSKIVIVECTFYDRDHRERARAGRHIHVDDFPKVCEALPNSKLVVSHITKRTDLRFAKRALERTLSPKDLERMTILMERPPRPDRARRTSTHAQRGCSSSPP